MDNTLPVSNKFRVLLVAIFLFFLCGVVGYVTFRQYNDSAGEFPTLQAQDLSPSTASLLLSGNSNSLDTNGSVYDLVLDTNGEVVSSVNLDFAFPSKDIGISLDKGDISAFENGVFTSKVDSDNQKLKLQFGTADGRTFTGKGVLAKLVLNRLANPLSTKAELKLLDSSYIKLAGYPAKAFSTSNVKSYSFDLGPLSVNASTSNNSTVISSVQTTAVVSATTSNTQTVGQTSASSTEQVSSSNVVSAQSLQASFDTVSQANSLSSQTVVSISSSNLSTSNTSIATSIVATSHSIISSSTTLHSLSSVGNSVSTSSSKSTTSGNLPATSADESKGSKGYIYAFFVIFGLGMTMFVRSRRKFDFENEISTK